MSQKKEFMVKLLGKPGGVASVELPFNAKDVWGKIRVPIKGTINGFPFRTTIAQMCGRQFFPVNKAMRDGAGVQGGDRVTIQIEPDDAPRTIEIPEPMKKALGVKLTSKLKEMAYTHQKEYVLWYTGAKKDETRERRVEKMKEMLAVGKKLS